MSDELQYIADTILLEKIVRLRAPIERQAGVFDTIGGALGGIAQQIQRYVIDNIDTSSTGGLALSVLNLAAAYMLGRKNLLLGLLYGVASAMGFGLDDIIKKMLSSVSGLLGGGKPVSASDIDGIGTQLISTQQEENQADDIVRDAFAPLRELDAQGQLFKFAAGPLDIFRTIGRYRTYSLVVRIIGWFLKTFLLSAGLLVGGGMIASSLGLAKPKATKVPAALPPGPSGGEVPRVSEQDTLRVSLPTVAAPPGLSPSGRGEEYHPNDEYTAWIVPIYGSAEDTLLVWTTEIYPQLRGHENIITSVPSFNRMANILGSHLDYRTPNYLLMPPGIHRRIDVVNAFIHDVAKRLPQQTASDTMLA